MKLAIHGFYGQGNLGDEAILTALLREFVKSPEMEVVVFSRDPEQVSRIHGVRSFPSRGKRGFLRRCWEIGNSDLFILGGGGLLKDYGTDSTSLEGWLSLLRMAMKLNVKTALCAVGVDNIRYDNSKRALRRTLSQVDLITVRDDHSRVILQDIGIGQKVKVTGDPAMLLAVPQPRGRKNLSPSPRIMVCVRHWFSKGNYIEDSEVNDNLIESLAKVMDYLVESYSSRVDFVPLRTTSYDDDRIIADQVVSRMKRTSYVTIHSATPGVNEFVNMLHQTSIVIGMRLHSLILATAIGVPVIGLEYMPKVKAYLEGLNQSEYSLPLQELTSHKLVSLVEDTFERYSIRSRMMCSEIDQAQERIRESLTGLIQLAQGE